ncbi:MAG: hypothetical protein V4508_04795 [Pseudomonadota bacterium]
MRDPVGGVSKANDAGMFTSSALSSAACASNELIGFTTVSLQESLHWASSETARAPVGSKIPFNILDYNDDRARVMQGRVAATNYPMNQ